MNVGVAMLVLNPPLDRMALLLDYLRDYGIDNFSVIIDSRTEPESKRIITLEWPHISFREIDWRNDFAWARNQGLDMIQRDWTLHLDPDELPSPGMMEHIKKVSSSPPGSALGYLYWTRNYWGGVPGEEMEYHWHTRLFRTGHGEWYRPVHELVKLDGQTEPHTRNTNKLPKAPKSAYLIHSKPADAIVKADELYSTIERGPNATSR